MFSSVCALDAIPSLRAVARTAAMPNNHGQLDDHVLLAEGDCAIPPVSMAMKGRLQMAAPTVSRTPNVHRAREPLTKSADGRVTITKLDAEVRETGRERRHACFPSLGSQSYGCGAVKAPDEPGKEKHQI